MVTPSINPSKSSIGGAACPAQPIATKAATAEGLVPGAGLALLPMFAWFWSEEPLLRDPRVVAPWVALIALLMVSSLATFSWTSFKLRRTVRFEALALIVENAGFGSTSAAPIARRVFDYVLQEIGRAHV